MSIFKNEYGIIPACDVPDMDSVLDLVRQTCSLDFIQGYKLGMELMLRYGAKSMLREIRKLTDLTIIYDHQKYGNDIPEISGGNVLRVLKDAGVDSIIIFPFAGIETLKATIDQCQIIGLAPIVGGEMTHRGFLVSENGYVADSSPGKIYRDAANLGVDTFVVPGTKIEKIRTYSENLSKIVSKPTFLFPGIGKGQGGDIAEAFKAASPHNSSAIIGRGIYAAQNSAEAAITLWESASSVL